MRRGYLFEQQVLEELQKLYSGIHKPEPIHLWVDGLTLRPWTKRSTGRPWRLVGHADGLTNDCVFDIKTRQGSQKAPSFWDRVQLYFYMLLYKRVQERSHCYRALHAFACWAWALSRPIGLCRRGSRCAPS